MVTMVTLVNLVTLVIETHLEFLVVGFVLVCSLNEKRARHVLLSLDQALDLVRAARTPTVLTDLPADGNLYLEDC